MRTTVFALAALLAACGGPPPSAREAQQRLADGDLDGAQQIVDAELKRFPRDGTLWNVKIRVRLARGDARGAVTAYREWRDLRGGDDRGALRAMAMTTLWQALGSPSADVKIAAIEAAVALDAEALADPVSRLLEDDDASVRAHAAASLLKFHPDAATVLTDSLTGDDAAARAIAVTAIGAKVGKRARADLENALADKDAGVRAAAVEALAKLKDPADATRFVALAGKDTDGRVRAAALRAFVAVRAGDAGITAARAALADDYLGARLAAVDALDDLAGKAAQADLERVTRADDPFVALRAGVALARRGSRAPGLTALRAALASTEWTVRAAGLNAAASIAVRDEAVPLVTARADDGEIQVRLAAARAFITLDRKDEARQILVAALSAKDDGVVVSAALDLMRLKDRQGTDAVARLAASSQDPEVRRQAVSYLAFVDGSHDALVGALADAAPRVRVAAALTIMQLR